MSQPRFPQVNTVSCDSGSCLSIYPRMMSSLKTTLAAILAGTASSLPIALCGLWNSTVLSRNFTSLRNATLTAFSVFFQNRSSIFLSNSMPLLPSSSHQTLRSASSPSSVSFLAPHRRPTARNRHARSFLHRRVSGQVPISCVNVTGDVEFQVSDYHCGTLAVTSEPTIHPEASAESYAPGAIARSFVGADPARAQRFSSCSLLCLESSVAKETKRRFDDDAGPAFSLQGLKRMTANFLDIKRLFS